MSIETGTNQSLSIEKIIERTWRLECFTEYGTDYRLVAHRERLFLLADGTIFKQEILAPISRTLSKVKDEPGALEFLMMTKTVVDRWAVEDAQLPKPEVINP